MWRRVRTGVTTKPYGILLVTMDTAQVVGDPLTNFFYQYPFASIVFVLLAVLALYWCASKEYTYNGKVYPSLINSKLSGKFIFTMFGFGIGAILISLFL